MATVNVASLIYQQALTSGVPPAIALAVAQKESGVSQWTSSGGLVTGSSGEIGVFQLMPGTAASLGVDPTDLTQNIQGGITFLAQLYQKYGDWAQALSAYNSGLADRIAIVCEQRAGDCRIGGACGCSHLI